MTPGRFTRTTCGKQVAYVPRVTNGKRQMPHSDWKPDLYLRFDTYRTRAARDLLARVDLDEAPFIADLGCGPGNSTALLAERWPTVKITGIDNSAEMINRARERYPGITWIE